jgi:TetR/AcrR family transcriptional regulator, fatty acid metabolism regulator protein
MNRRSLRDADAGSLPRRERERRQRHADILHAAEEVFAANGFHAASIEQIARAAEYATGTVYLYFRDKEALYLELFEEKICELGELIRRQTTGINDPVEAIRRLVEARMDYFERNRAFFRIYAREGMNRYETRHDRWTGVMRLYTDYLELLAGIIRSGQRRRLFRKGDAHQVAVALSGMMIQLTRDLLQSQHERPLTDLSPFVTDLFLKGALAKDQK